MPHFPLAWAHREIFAFSWALMELLSLLPSLIPASLLGAFTSIALLIPPCWDNCQAGRGLAEADALVSPASFCSPCLQFLQASLIYWSYWAYLPGVWPCLERVVCLEVINGA